MAAAEFRLEDLDDAAVYRRSRDSALKPSTRNFVVDFGQKSAGIAFDVEAEDVRSLLGSAKKADAPVRWINIWGPNRQTDIVKLLADKYKFSPRLLAVIASSPPPPSDTPQSDTKHDRKKWTRAALSDDVELAKSSAETSRMGSPRPGTTDSTSHYKIAKSMVQYQSFDVGAHFLCIGANWMYRRRSEDLNIAEEGKRRPLWCWLVLCDDNTVISLHEDTGVGGDNEYLESLRYNTISVMSQLSTHGHLSVDPISMQSVRQTMERDATRTDPGMEGSSNLFYYLFDDWRAVYATITAFRARLDELEQDIFEDMNRKSNKAPNIEIIPRLHVLSRRVRQMQHLYEGYKNLTGRILDYKSTSAQHHIASFSRSSSVLDSVHLSRGVLLAQSSSTRFERLGDRIQYLILSEITQFLAESEALIDTYFNINAQKDSESSARLTRSATLLAKLSVLFLPVSFMTSYFSVQIPDLNHYTGKDYWSAFAVIMSLSFLALFFFSRMLMSITEVMDAWVKSISKYCSNLVGIKVSRQRTRRRA